jgi:hypothetical protein
VTPAPPAAMITEDFWVYVSGIIRDHGTSDPADAVIPAPSVGAAHRGSRIPDPMITDDFWVYVSGIFRDHETRAAGGASAVREVLGGGTGDA